MLNLPGTAGPSAVLARLNQSLDSGSATSSWVVAAAAAVAVVVVESAFGDARRRDPALG